MDKDVKELLISWDLTEYIEIFTENKISVDTLNFLDSELIKELIPPIGDRARFSKNLCRWNELSNSDKSVTKLRHPTAQEYQDVFGVSLTSPDKSVCSSPAISDVSDISTFIIDAPSTFTLENTDNFNKYTSLNDLLMSTLEGRGLLNLYGDSGLISSNGRRKLCNIIIKHILEKNPRDRVSSATLFFYAQEIANLFKQENISTYFVPYISNAKLKIKRLAKGKLYDCLQNRKRDYRTSLRKDNTKENFPPETGSHSDIDSAEVIEDITWLKNSCDSWDVVNEKWQKTREFRHREIMNESHTIQSYMESYPALQKPAGFHLLVSDFAYHYPESNDKLTENFPLYKQKILELAVKKFRKHPDKSLTEFIEEYVNTLKEESTTSAVTAVETTSIHAFMFLPLLLGNPVGKNKKKCWRPSKQEARDAFLTHLKSEVELKEAINRRKEKYAALGLTFQPTIFIVGPAISDIKGYYITVNNIFYVVNSIIEAVDVTFKLFYSLHCEYPTECYTVYAFLQKGFYKLNTKWDKEFTAVNALLADLDIK